MSLNKVMFMFGVFTLISSFNAISQSFEPVPVQPVTLGNGSLPNLVPSQTLAPVNDLPLATPLPIGIPVNDENKKGIIDKVGVGSTIAIQNQPLQEGQINIPSNVIVPTPSLAPPQNVVPISNIAPSPVVIGVVGNDGNQQGLGNNVGIGSAINGNTQQLQGGLINIPSNTIANPGSKRGIGSGIIFQPPVAERKSGSSSDSSQWPDASVCINPTSAAKRSVCLPPRLSYVNKSPVQSGATIMPAIEMSWAQSAELIMTDLVTNKKTVVWNFTNGEFGRYYYPADLLLPVVKIINDTEFTLAAKNPYFPMPTLANKGMVKWTVATKKTLKTGLGANAVNDKSDSMADLLGKKEQSNVMSPIDHVPGCDVAKDKWGCQKPYTPFLYLAPKYIDIMNGKKGDPMNQTVYFELDYGNASKVTIESLADHYSPYLLFKDTQASPQKKMKEKMIALGLLQQSYRIKVFAKNPHGIVVKEVKYSMDQLVLPEVKEVKWTSGTSQTTKVDPSQKIDLLLDKVQYADTIDIELTTIPSKCDGSVFRSSATNKVTVKNPLGVTSRYARIPVPIVLKSCPGTRYQLQAMLTPKQHKVLYQSTVKLSDKLQVTGANLVKPEILKTSLVAKNSSAKGIVLAGDELTLNVEFVNAQELIVEGANGKSIIHAKGFGGQYNKAPAYFFADDAVSSGFDLIVKSTQGGRVYKDEKRFIPKIRRKVKLTTNLVWTTPVAFTQLPSTLDLTCLVGKDKTTGGVDYKVHKLTLNGNRSGSKTVTFDIEIPLRDDSKDNSKIYYVCNATSKGGAIISGGNATLGYGGIGGELPSTYANWPVREVSVATKPFRISIDK